jgi:TfoX/Sxy family transcriptional regulator of competence genes
MAYGEELADRLRLLLAGRGLTEKRMFGGLAFLLHGHMAVAASGQGGLLVRVPPEQTDALRAEPGVEPFVMQHRSMTGWLRVAPEALEDDAMLRAWAERGLAYAGSLPPKDRRPPG